MSLKTTTYACDLCGDETPRDLVVWFNTEDLGFCSACHEGPLCHALHPAGDVCLQRVGHRGPHGQLYSARWA